MEAEIVRNHALISDAATRFVRYAVDDRRCLAKLQLLDDDMPEGFRNYQYALHSWPWFVSPNTQERLARCVREIPRLLVKALRLEFGKDHGKLARFFDVPDVLSVLFLESPIDTENMVQRTDAIYTERGLKILELNIGSNIGGWQIHWLDRQYRKQPELAPFFADTPCETRNIPGEFMSFLIGAATRLQLQADRMVHVLFIVNPDDFDPSAAECIDLEFQQALRDCGQQGQMHVATSFDDVTFKADQLYYRGRRIGVLCFSDFKLVTPPTQLYRSAFANQVLWTENPLYRIVGDKRCLAILFAHRSSPMFSEEERSVIEEFVPWSATFQAQGVSFEGRRYDLADLLLREKDRFVVKHANGAQGNHVYVGKHTSRDNWSRVVEHALVHPEWVVQEYCPSLPFYGQCGEQGVAIFDVVWGIFGFGRCYGGSWLRLMEKGAGNGVVNSDKGAEEAIVYEAMD